MTEREFFLTLFFHTLIQMIENNNNDDENNKIFDTKINKTLSIILPFVRSIKLQNYQIPFVSHVIYFI